MGVRLQDRDKMNEFKPRRLIESRAEKQTLLVEEPLVVFFGWEGGLLESSSRTPLRLFSS